MGLKKKTDQAKEKIKESQKAMKIRRDEKEKMKSSEKAEPVKDHPVEKEKNIKKNVEKQRQKGDNKKIEKIDTSALLQRKKERDQWK